MTADAESSGDKTLTFWHNSTTGEGKAYWEQTVADFEKANPGVKVTVQAIQNEDMDGKLQTALNSGDAPDVFMARGGGKLADVVEAGQAHGPDVQHRPGRQDGGRRRNLQGADRQRQDLRHADLDPSRRHLLQQGPVQAGRHHRHPQVDRRPEAAVTKLKAAGIQPIALGAKDAWPAAHWYYFFALRECSQDALNKAAETCKFEDPCWTKAGEDLRSFRAPQPFNKGFLTTSAQQGAGSSAGLVANHKAAMELMGAWDPGVIASLTTDQKPLADLGWFPFPSTSGGQG